MSVATDTIQAAAPSLNVTEIVTNFGILVTFIIAAVVGIYQGLKKVKQDVLGGEQIEPNKIKAATIMETITLSEWSATNKDVTRELAANTASNYHLRDCLREQTKSIDELAHQIERLRDKMG